MTRLGALTSPEVAAGPSRVLLVPVGSIEQHGPHLPLDTDVRIAEAVAVRVVDARADFVLGPTLPIGAAGEHAGFAGTLSVGTAALTEVLVELRRSLGPEFGALAVVNAHGGNLDALGAVERRCRDEGREVRTWTVRLPGADAHAGRTETSLMLAIAPDVVRVDLAEAGATDDLADLLPALRRGGVGAVSPNGVLGDPAGASAAEGETLLARLVASATTALAS
jgi:creatinine amidohydrolase